MRFLVWKKVGSGFCSKEKHQRTVGRSACPIPSGSQKISLTISFCLSKLAYNCAYLALASWGGYYLLLKKDGTNYSNVLNYGVFD